MKRLIAVAGATLTVAVALPGGAGASGSYHFCSTAGSGTTYLQVLTSMPCSQARALERAAIRSPVLSNGPTQTGRWWSALSQKWQTVNRGMQRSGAYRGTFEYGIWSARKGIDTCPTAWFFDRHRLS
jgi:hypothetical protein